MSTLRSSQTSIGMPWHTTQPALIPSGLSAPKGCIEGHVTFIADFDRHAMADNSTGTIGKTPDQSMTIMTFDNNKFVVQGVSPGDKYWIGLGELKGNEGYFDYRFKDGRSGQTTFRVDKNGNLDARSLSFTVDYKYLAKKRN